MSITIPSSVISIGKYAFFGCEKLTKISIPSSVKKIENRCFDGCTSLEEILIPSSILSIGVHSFGNCSKLKQIEIPTSVKFIDEYAFYNCSSLKEIIVPKSVKKIGDYFIKNCFALEKIIIPSNIKNVGQLNFKDFISLKEFVIPSSVNTIEYGQFDQCKSLTKIEIPSSVTMIGQLAFNGCSSLIEVNLPPSLESIEYNAFSGCKSLVKVTIPSSIYKIGFNAFSGCEKLEKIVINQSVKNTLKIDVPDIKITILGASDVGKSFILGRYIEGINFKKVLPTICPTHISKKVNIEGNNIKINFVDIHQNDRFQCITNLFYRDSYGVAVVFDLTVPESLDQTKKFFNVIYEINGQIPSILLGNKCELIHNVDEIKIKQLEEEFNTKFFEVSAMEGTNVDTAFEYLAKKILKDFSDEKSRLENLFSYEFFNKCHIF